MPRTKRKTKTANNSKGTIDLLVQMMNDMNAKLHTVHKEVTKNAREVSNLKEQMAVGRGGVKVLVWITGMTTTVVAVWKFLIEGK